MNIIPISFLYNPQSVYVNQNTSSALYSFTSFTFTNAGAVGRQGPTYQQLTSSYSASANWVTTPSFFTASIRGIQQWTVPETATYRVEAAGAAGGSNPSISFNGGYGALVITDVILTQGQKINIVIGQKGGNRYTGSGASPYNGGSGGGGTFMYDSASLSYYVAVGGGGGAAGNATNLYSNQATASGKYNTTSGSSVVITLPVTASGGWGGRGGYITNRTPTPILYGGPGAGVNSSGSAANGGQGLSRVNNWLGGTTGSTSNINGVEGGFGGGGGAVDGDASADANSIGWAGGGGGYSGGACGGNSGQSNSSYAGGGGTYYSGTIVSGSNNTNQSNGYIIITKL
jgi:hypothetical protein